MHAMHAMQLHQGIDNFVFSKNKINSNDSFLSR